MREPPQGGHAVMDSVVRNYDLCIYYASVVYE